MNAGTGSAAAGSEVAEGSSTEGSEAASGTTSRGTEVGEGAVSCTVTVLTSVPTSESVEPQAAVVTATKVHKTTDFMVKRLPFNTGTFRRCS
ncbi:putative uncharacterized protein [Rhodococcus sp. AW25M09]|nr:putative uncharacterized protein [Rhodococcus sp. AW25M09]